VQQRKLASLKRKSITAKGAALHCTAIQAGQHLLGGPRSSHDPTPGELARLARFCLQDLSQAWDSGQGREAGAPGAALEGFRSLLLSGSFDESEFGNGSQQQRWQQPQQQQLWQQGGSHSNGGPPAVQQPEVNSRSVQ